MHLVPSNGSLVPPRLGLKPKEEGKLLDTQINQVILPSLTSAALWCGKDKKTLQLGALEAGKFKSDGPCPQWQSASPCREGSSDVSTPARSYTKPALFPLFPPENRVCERL